MEEKKNSGLLVVVAILCLLIGGVVGYFISNNYMKTNEANNKINTQNNKDASITEEKVRQIYSEGIKKYLSDSVRSLNFDSETFANEEDKLEWILGLGLTDGLESIGEYCGTDLEKNLIEENVIVEKGTGQADCESVTFYKADSVIEAVKKVFGSDASFNLNKLNEGDSKLFPYIENHNLVFVLRAGMTADVVDNYVGYSVDSNVLTIKFSITDNDNNISNYEAKYLIDGDNAYIRTIKKI